MELSPLPLRTNAPTLPLESRYFTRASVALDVTLSIDGRPHARGRLVDVSEGGAKVVVAGACAIGARVEMEARFMPTQRPVALTGEVVRVERPGSDSLLGVEWSALDASAALAIGVFVGDREPLSWDDSTRLPRAVAEQFVPVVKRIAHGLAVRLPAHVSVDDLVGAGFVGLVELHAKKPGIAAADFEQLAKVRIRGAMLDHLRRADPLARRARKGVRQIAQVRARIEGTLQRAATHEEVQRALGVTSDVYQSLLSRADAAVAAGLDDDSNADLADVRAESGDDVVAASETRRALERAFHALPPRLQKVLDLHYTEDLTLRAIGNLLGVSEARVSQLLGQAVAQLRRSCVDEAA